MPPSTAMPKAQHDELKEEDTLGNRGSVKSKRERESQHRE